MPKATGTVLEIDLGALKHNYSYLRSRLDPGTKFLAVVKAFGYGSDALQVAKTLEAQGADYLAVAYVSEGVALRDGGVESPILVLHPQPANFDEAIDRCLEPNLYSRRVLREFLKAARKKEQKEYPVHIKFNTGLNRLGFDSSDSKYIADQLKGQSEIRVRSLMSHLAASEDANELEFSRGQIREFTSIASELSSNLGYSPILHMLNTSGIINYPEAQLDMVRSGIGLYGYGNDAKIDRELRPVGTLKTVISQIHTIEPGETVGYNRAFTAGGEGRSATLPIGHADGLGRHFGQGKGYVWIGDKKAPIIGNVCMDMVMVDVSDIPCAEGDEVVVFGGKYSAEDLALSGNTISYELLAGISQRVKRLFVGENA